MGLPVIQHQMRLEQEGNGIWFARIRDHSVVGVGKTRSEALHNLADLITGSQDMLIRTVDPHIHEVRETILNEPLNPNLTEDSANFQVGGQHYKGVDIQHWDWALAQPWGVGYMIGQITKYASRNKNNVVEDLKKARHFVTRLIQFHETGK